MEDLSLLIKQTGFFILLSFVCYLPANASNEEERKIRLDSAAAAVVPQVNDEEWRIGGKIHFEEESRSDYIGTKEINNITKNILKEILNIYADSCSDNAKIMLKKEFGHLKMTHYEEKSRPGTGEELHATLLYTKPRSLCRSETLQQTCASLFGKCESPPTIESVARAYSTIIAPAWKFRISGVILEKSQTGASYIIAKLLFDGRNNIYKDGKPISAELHMTLVNVADGSVWAHNKMKGQLIKKLNKELKGKLIKVATKNGISDLEFGISGTPWRIRAEKRMQ